MDTKESNKLLATALSIAALLAVPNTAQATEPDDVDQTENSERAAIDLCRSEVISTLYGLASVAISILGTEAADGGWSLGAGFSQPGDHIQGAAGSPQALNNLLPIFLGPSSCTPPVEILSTPSVQLKPLPHQEVSFSLFPPPPILVAHLNIEGPVKPSFIEGIDSKISENPPLPWAEFHPGTVVLAPPATPGLIAKDLPRVDPLEDTIVADNRGVSDKIHSETEGTQ